MYSGLSNNYKACIEFSSFLFIFMNFSTEKISVNYLFKTNNLFIHHQLKEEVRDSM